jgi:hypothetical protein
MPILNLKKNKRIKEKIRLTSHRLKLFLFVARKDLRTSGFVFVSEMSETQISFYLDQTIKSGTELQVSFESETAQGFRSRILICNRYAMSQKFIGSSALNFRATAQFIFSSEFEREQYLKFYNETRERLLFLNRPVKIGATPTTSSQPTQVAATPEPGSAADVSSAEKKAA